MNVIGNNQYTNISANTAGTVLLNHSGILHSITIGVKGATSNLLSIYDSATTNANLVAQIDTTANVGSIMLDVQLLNGLYVVLAAGTAANITISYQG